VLVVDGIRRRFDVDVDAASASVTVDSPLGSTVFGVVPRFEEIVDDGPRGSLNAPMPGTIVNVPVRVGDAVERGTVVVVLEAMKMEHSIRAPEAGLVTELRVAIGDQVEVGAVLAVVIPPE
jgi:propionyl-CoA carboxylase alpha chain